MVTFESLKLEDRWRIVLGSSSTTRKAVLENAGWKFETMSPDVNEKDENNRCSDPHRLPLCVAQAKCKALLPKVGGRAFLVCADQVVIRSYKRAVGNEVKDFDELREKPADKKELGRFIRDYSSTTLPIEFANGIVVTNTESQKTAMVLQSSFAEFRRIPEQVIRAIVKNPEFMLRAGGISIEHPLMKPYIIRIVGGEDSVMGLPLEKVAELITKVK